MNFDGMFTTKKKETDTNKKCITRYRSDRINKKKIDR